MKGFFKFILKAVIVIAVLLIAALNFIKWRMDHEVAAVTPLAMSTEDVDLTVTLDPNFLPQTLPPSGEPQPVSYTHLTLPTKA